MAKIDDSVKKSPQLRFEGFTDDWEDRKLIDVAEMFDNLRIPVTASDRVQGNTAYYGANGIQDYVDGFTHDGEFVLIAEDGANDLINYPVNYVKGKIWVNNHAHVVSGEKSELDNLFLTARIKSMNISHWLVGGGRAKLNGDVLKKIPLTLPVYEEQKKIGAYFKHLDDSIALHQRKLDLLKEQKKGYLQKMFPKNGEKVPELRFAGFADDWEQRKFKDLLDSRDGIRRGPFGSALKKDLFVKESKYVVYEQQNAIYDRFNTRYNITEEKYKELIKFKVEPDDFIMSGAGTIGRISIVPNGIKPGVFNQALIRFRLNHDKTDSKYFLQLMRSETMQRKLTESNPGSAMVNLVPMSEVKKWDILVPDISEQKLLGIFFTNFDQAIALHQRKLDLLKEQKKGFLQKMFV